MTHTNPDVDTFFKKAKRWRPEMERLRAIVLDRGLTEELKWHQPCYTDGKKNVVIVSSFKDYCVLAFFKGALLEDPEGILVPPGENSRHVRQARFTDVAEIDELEPVLKAYIDEAIQVEEVGLKVQPATELTLPEELEAKFHEDPDLKAAFEGLTPGRQRAYVIHFSGAKQSKTRRARIERCRERILAGKGLNDR